MLSPVLLRSTFTVAISALTSIGFPSISRGGTKTFPSMISLRLFDLARGFSSLPSEFFPELILRSSPNLGSIRSCGCALRWL